MPQFVFVSQAIIRPFLPKSDLYAILHLYIINFCKTANEEVDHDEGGIIWNKMLYQIILVLKLQLHLRILDSLIPDFSIPPQTQPEQKRGIEVGNQMYADFWIWSASIPI